MRVLVTAGATREPIDSVRYISNLSSGKTGAVISETLNAHGFEILHFAGAGAVLPLSTPTLSLIRFSSFADLDLKLKTTLAASHFDAIIHCAAVSDYSLTQTFQGKVNSDVDTLTLNLRRNPKIVHHLLSYSLNPKLKVIAFKLTDSSDESVRRSAIDKLALHPQIHLVVHNDLSQVSDSLDHTFHIYQGDSRLRSITSKQDLALSLKQFIHGECV